jgi:hypothetical protein
VVLFQKQNYVFLQEPFSFSKVKKLYQRLKSNNYIIRGVSKMFGEWYQKTNKTEDINKLTLLTFKIIAILHNTVGNVHKASGNCLQGPL